MRIRLRSAAIASFVTLLFVLPLAILTENVQTVQAASDVNSCRNLGSVDIISRGDDGAGNVAVNAIDNDLDTRWSNMGARAWIRIDLGEEEKICSVDVAWYKGDYRVYNFTISVSRDNDAYTDVYSGRSSGSTLEQETYNLDNAVEGRYVKINVQGNSENNWASITEIDIFGENTRAGPIRYTVYHTSYSNETIDILEKHFADPGDNNNYLYEDTRVKAIVQNFSNQFEFIVGGTSYDQITTKKFITAEQYGFDSSDVIVYDIESWDSTPEDEQKDVAGSITEVMKVIKEMGYGAGTTPDADMIMENYKKIDWTEVDFLGIQIQRFTGDTDNLVQWTEEISSHVKSVNPNTEVFVQVSFGRANNCYDWDNSPPLDPDCEVDVEQSLSKLEYNLEQVARLETVDGFIVSYLPTTNSTGSSPSLPCPAELCSPANLDRILTHIEGIGQ